MFEMKPYETRTPDSQYQSALRYILRYGRKQEKTIQGKSCISCLHVPPLFFDLENGIPLITERKISFWRIGIGEILAFINGARTQAELEKFGCKWWSSWVTGEKCSLFGLKEGDLGSGSYGEAFARFPSLSSPEKNRDGNIPDQLNQFEAVIENLKENPDLRTHEISPWIPFPIIKDRKVVVAPCHGWIHLQVLDGKLNLVMRQRSADMPIGVPMNIFQYAALTMALAQVLELKPCLYVHQLCDAHIYNDQIPAVYEMLDRRPKQLPTLSITDPTIRNIFDFRPEHFVLSDYDPHPAIKDIPVSI